MDWNWKTKAGVVGGTILVMSVMGYIIKIQHDTVERLKFIETSVVESKNIGNGIVREQASYVTKKDLENMMKDQGMDLASIKKDLAVLGANINGISTVKVITQGYKADHLPSSNTTERDNTETTQRTDVQTAATTQDLHGYQSATQWFNLSEPIGKETIPFGKVGFSAWDAKPWSEQISPRTYSSITVLGKNEEGRSYTYTKFTIDVDGKKYVVPITEAKIAEEYPSPSFHWSPRLYLGVDFGVIANPPMHFEVMPDLGLSLFSYGQTKLNPDWTFLTLGLGYETQTKGIAFLLNPVDYNIAKHLPFVENLYLGPSVSLDPKGNFGLYLGIRVGL
ncbi:hypothetical protein M0R72_02985 [Candidatus Pacearchaeota archaeon]|jgi:hypothetical protein|nr:hypothetical protein [Candidatus Pacearchaeota archaeon]